MVQFLYENKATYKGQFFEIQFLRNRLDSQFSSAHKFTNDVRRVNRLRVRVQGNYGLIAIRGKRSLSCSKCRETSSGKLSAFLSKCTGRGGESSRGKSGRGVKLRTDQFQIPFV